MTRIDLVTVRTVDNRDPRDMARWQEARADALRERLVRMRMTEEEDRNDQVHGRSSQ